ncbi:MULTISPECIES: hypothetical protein [Moorena]|uniref:hypothetical protein n=1 Tax=Moorena TaxID=1155738 RepID=UPI0012B62DD4|nr:MULTISPECIES: hypothetical protein [Moorena]NEP30108.1 hypothetical protein [Moorena sp. SIO3B2]NEP65053.1 hypothetical protein [Moorena sp. SIO3A5]NEQ06723.1 hypothetical protein [Moorena sp. SIO4E2]NER91365.1 hypothetical protein [Moorena sp. SIO3A2]NES44271.1 hypothetical protein [Moorena sp. SIO2C4]
MDSGSSGMAAGHLPVYRTHHDRDINKFGNPAPKVKRWRREEVNNGLQTTC